MKKAKRRVSLSTLVKYGALLIYILFGIIFAYDVPNTIGAFLATSQPLLFLGAIVFTTKTRRKLIGGIFCLGCCSLYSLIFLFPKIAYCSSMVIGSYLDEREISELMLSLLSLYATNTAGFMLYDAIARYVRLFGSRKPSKAQPAGSPFINAEDEMKNTLNSSRMQQSAAVPVAIKIRKLLTDNGLEEYLMADFKTSVEFSKEDRNDRTKTYQKLNIIFM